MAEIRKPTVEVQSKVVAAAFEDSFPVAKSEWSASPWLALAAGFVAIEESWGLADSADLVETLRSYVGSPDPFIDAAAATRAGVLASWWSEDPLRDPAGDVTRWARHAVAIAPDWVSNWLLLASCLSAQGEKDKVIEIADRLSLVSPISAPEDHFDRALERIVTGRLDWDPREAENMRWRASQNR